MASIKATELDFFQIKDNLKEYLRTQDKFKDYDFDGAGLSVLLDVLSYNTHYNAVNANMALNEVFLDSAQFRNNVVSHAKMLGYVPRSINSAFATIDLIVNSPTGSPASLLMPRGTEFSSSLDGVQYTFTLLTSQTITPNGSGVYSIEDLQINEGRLKTFSYIVDSFDGNLYFQIPDSTIDINSLVVKVRANVTSDDVTTFALARNFVEVTSTTNAYFIQESLDGKYEIYFGDGVVGKKLDASNVVELEWLSTNGTVANDCNTFSLSSTIQGNSDVAITTVTKAVGGYDRESIDSIKFNAPLSYVAQNRVITPDDYKVTITNGYSNIETISVWGGEENDPPEYGKVYISIKPNGSAALNVVEKQFIIDNIIKPKAIVSVIPEIVDPEYTYVKLEVFFKYNPNLTSKTESDLRQLVLNVIQNYNNTDLKKFDGVLRASKLQRLIDTCDPAILNSNIRVYMQKRFIPVLNSTQTYSIEYSSPLYSSDSNETVLSSTGFTYNGITQYLVDNPNIPVTEVQAEEGDIIHRLQLYKIIGNDNIVTIEDVGYVITNKGLVVITDFNPSSFEGNHITLNASPNSNDIAPKRNQLLEIDLSLTTVTPEIDTIATGGSVAGVGYITTPRHAD